jgi:hypothetical protein
MSKLIKSTFLEEDKAPEAAPAPAVAEEKKEAAPADAEGAPEKHEDVEQDIALIKQLLDEYLGKESYGEADVAACQGAMQAAMEMGGHTKEEAMKMAAQAMKMAGYMQKAEAKKTESKAEEKPAAEEPKAEEKPVEETAKESDDEDEEEEAKEAAVTESDKRVKELEAKLAEQAGVIATLKESTKKIDLEKHLDGVCQKSGLPREATKLFRESLGEIKTKEQIDSAWKLFEGGYKSRRGGEVTVDMSDVFVQPEKAAPIKSESVGFSDCLN